MNEFAAEPIFVEQIRRGDEAAWRRFIEHYEGRLTAFVRRRLGDAAAVDDVVQETFMGFLLSLAHYDASRGLETYLFTIAAHKLTDHLRRLGRRPTVPLTTASDSSAIDPGPADSARSAASAIRSLERRGAEADVVAQALSEVLRQWRAKEAWTKLEVVELLFVREKSNKDAAALLATTEQNVANIKFDFLSRVRQGVRQRACNPDLFPELNAANDP